MGIKMPIVGYVAVSGGSNQFMADRRAAEIKKFFDAISGPIAIEELKKFSYPGEFEIGQVFFETDIVARPVLRSLANKKDLGSLVVCYRDDLYVGSKSTEDFEEQKLNAELIKRIVDEMIPVISIKSTKDNAGRTLTSEINQRSNESKRNELYFLIADNYADNRNSLEKHYKNILSKKTDAAA
ncbi:hypothetical protein [Devosia sp. Naph2]|uniref:hypothetical protein n=1 Tax=Devosia polycyclovorans TaxID=3345148 RepID=UPI0035D0E11A